MKLSNKTPLVLAVSSTVIAGLTPTLIHAESLSGVQENNPFELTELSTGYMQMAKSDSSSDSASKMKSGSCGEGKCGSATMSGSEEKTAEGKCAGNKPMPKAKKADKATEGKCGEGKCGSSM